MVFINEKYKVIFIENPKCASSTILKALTKVLDSDYVRETQPENAHITSFDIKETYGLEIWNTYTKVSTYRDPFKRFKSSLMFEIHKKYYGNIETFENISEHIKNNDDCTYCISQKAFTDGMDVLLNVDNLQEDFDNLCAKLGVETITLEKKNTNKEFTSRIRSDKLLELFDLYNKVHDDRISKEKAKSKSKSNLVKKTEPQFLGSITDNILTVTKLLSETRITSFTGLEDINETIKTGILFYGTGTGGLGTYILTTEHTAPDNTGFIIHKPDKDDDSKIATPYCAIVVPKFVNIPLSHAQNVKNPNPNTTNKKSFIEPVKFNLGCTYNNTYVWCWSNKTTKDNICDVVYLSNTLSNKSLTNNVQLLDPSSDYYKYWFSLIPDFIPRNPIGCKISSITSCINKSNPQNIVIGFGTILLYLDSNNNDTEYSIRCQATSFDGGATFTNIGPINIQSDTCAATDCPVVQSDIYGNIWCMTTDSVANAIVFLISPDGGLTYYTAYTSSPPLSVTDHWETPKMCFGYDGINHNITTMTVSSTSINTNTNTNTNTDTNTNTNTEFTLTVDSTIDFPSSGMLDICIDKDKKTNIIVSYTSIVENSFTGCVIFDNFSYITIPDGATINTLGNYGLYFIATYYMSDFTAPFMGFIPVTGKMCNNVQCNNVPCNNVPCNNVPCNNVLRIPIIIANANKNYIISASACPSLSDSVATWLFNFGSNMPVYNDIAVAQDGRLFNLMGNIDRYIYKSPPNAVHPEIITGNWAGPFGLDIDTTKSTNLNANTFRQGNSINMVFDEKRQALYKLSVNTVSFAISRNNGLQWSEHFIVSEHNLGSVSMSFDPIKSNLVFGWYDTRNSYNSVEYYGAIITSEQLDILVSNIVVINQKYVIP